MRSRSFIRALMLAVMTVVAAASPVLAQTAPAPVPPEPVKGFPWYFWLGVVAAALALLQGLLVLVGFMVQKRGFDRTQRPRTE